MGKKDIKGNTVIDLAYISGHQDLGNWLVKYQQKQSGKIGFTYTPSKFASREYGVNLQSIGAPANLVSMSTSQNSGQSSHAIIAQRLNQTGRQDTENRDEQHNIPSDFSPSHDADFWSNLGGETGRTAAQYAAMAGNRPILSLLEEKGADLNQANGFGKNPLQDYQAADARQKSDDELDAAINASFELAHPIAANLPPGLKLKNATLAEIHQVIRIKKNVAEAAKYFGIGISSTFLRARLLDFDLTLTYEELKSMDIHFARSRLIGVYYQQMLHIPKEVRNLTLHQIQDYIKNIPKINGKFSEMLVAKALDTSWQSLGQLLKDFHPPTTFDELARISIPEAEKKFGVDYDKNVSKKISIPQAVPVKLDSLDKLTTYLFNPPKQSDTYQQHMSRLIDAIQSYQQYRKNNNAVNEVGNVAGKTLAMVAAQLDRSDIILALKKYCGANLNQADHTDTTPLMFAVLNGNNEVAGLLLELNVNISACDQTGRTAAHYAAMAGNRPILSLLEKKRADLNQADVLDVFGKTPSQYYQEYQAAQTQQAPHSSFSLFPTATKEAATNQRTTDTQNTRGGFKRKFG